MATGVVSWSQTAANNATADANVNWAEGQAPSTVNDSARAGMASVAKYRDDIAGAIATGGTSTAYTVTSYQGFGTLAAMHQQIIAFTVHTTNGATVTLNVDSLGAKPLRSSPGVELVAGCLVQGTPYMALYNNSDSAFYLHGFFGSTTYNVPLGAGMDYWGSSAPNSSFAFPTGQAISRSTYATLFTLISTTYGVGDGSTTFNLPDKTGRVSAMKEASATRLTSTYFGGNSTNLGATGGLESNTLTTTTMPSHSHTITDPTHSHAGVINGAGAVATAGQTGSSSPQYGGANTSTSAASTGITGTNSAGTGSPHNNTQPTIICNYIIRII